MRLGVGETSACAKRVYARLRLRIHDLRRKAQLPKSLQNG